MSKHNYDIMKQFFLLKIHYNDDTQFCLGIHVLMMFISQYTILSFFFQTWDTFKSFHACSILYTLLFLQLILFS